MVQKFWAGFKELCVEGAEEDQHCAEAKGRGVAGWVPCAALSTVVLHSHSGTRNACPEHRGLGLQLTLPEEENSMLSGRKYKLTTKPVALLRAGVM